MKNIVRITGCVVVSTILCVGSALAATINDYCITPPFIQQSVNPNLLLMIDNSASMYDIASIDRQNYCANASITACTADATCATAAMPRDKCVKNPATACTSDADCTAAGDVCNLPKCVKSGAACSSDASCTAPDFCNNKCNTQHVCWDNTYDDTAVYAGYYDKAAVYGYDFTNKKFTSGATMPGTCSYSAGTTKYVCVVSAGTPEAVTGFTASGKFLNWLTASNFDIEKKILTGGKYDTVKSVLAAETRGCSGRKFMKTLDTMPGITFAISGGTASTLGLTSNSTAYGQTFLQVYKGTYAASSCQNVVSLWKTMTAANQDTVMSALCKCVGGTYNPSGGTFGTGACTVGSGQFKLAPFYQIAYDCACFIGGLCNYSGGGSFQNFTPIQRLCEADYLANYFTLGPAGITDPAASDYICAKLPSSTAADPKNVGAGCTWNTITSGVQTLTFSATNKTITRAAGSFLTDGFAVGNTIMTDDTLNKGPFTIKAVTATVITVNEALVANGPTGNVTVTTHTCTWDATGSVTIPAQLAYCSGVVNLNPVIDPSFGTLSTAATVSVPGFLVQAGLSGLTLMGVTGDLVDGKLASQIGLAPAPTGLIDKYKDRIRFGAMAFNDNGSGSECSDTGTCQITTATSCTSSANCPLIVSSSGTTTTHELCLKPFPCGKRCSVTTNQLCYTAADCPSPESCDPIPKTDGGKIIAFAGAGYCSVTTTTPCSVDLDCASLTPAGQTCIASVGNHNSGLVKAIDDIKATSWTPHAETFYNAIAYYVKDAIATNASLDTTKYTPAASAINAPISGSDSYSNKNPIQYKCQSNNILLVTDGSSTADINSTMVNKVRDSSGNFRDPATTAETGATSTTFTTPAYTANVCGNYYGSPYLHDLSYFAQHRNIFDPSKDCSVTTCDSAQKINSYVVYTGNTTTSTSVCDPYNAMNTTATNGGTTLFAATDPTKLNTALDSAFTTIAAKAVSGTAASILSNSEGSGAALLQAIFYPLKNFDNSTKAAWIGELQSFWYYLDPYLQKTSIREDTNGDFKLNLIDDKIVQFYFDTTDNKTKVNKYSDPLGKGLPTSPTPAPDPGFAGVSPETVKSLWMAGQKLWSRNLSTSARTIYTGYNSTGGGTPAKFSNVAADNFNTSTSTAVWDILQIPDTTTSPGITDTQRMSLATKLIDYVSGSDPLSYDETAPCLTPACKYRSRKVTIQSFCASGATDFSACTHEWKLGDIISSTPKLASTTALNNYNLPSPTGYNDSSYGSFISTAAYKNRGMAFVGANDGMLHAFNLGVMKALNGAYDKARINTASGSAVTSDLQAELGQEAWAFIPRHALPYLKYLADPTYSHLYYVDRSALIVDVSIARPAACAAATDYSECTKPGDGSTWRTILIGGMGLGGASRDFNNITTGYPSVKSPAPGIGYSAYFALDVTDPANPKYLWEFFGDIGTALNPQPRTGFTTTGPAIVRIAAKKKKADGTYTTDPDHTKNGKWFAVFGNGPFGPIDQTDRSFKGQSENNLRLFVVDLATGLPVRIINCTTLLGIGSAFVGSFSSNVIDADRNSPNSPGFYSDDAIYVGYTQKALDGTWTKGGVLRITTMQSTDPNLWVVSKVIDNIGPVTTSTTKLQDRGNKKLWVYFGTGRYFYKSDDTSTTQQAIYGVKDPCYNTLTTPGNYYDSSCTASVDSTNILDQSGSSSAPAATLPATATGWKIILDAKDITNGLMTERIITDPLASPNGAVFFTSFKPSSDLCKYGGNSLLWAVRYDTGATPPASAMGGKALMQVSTGAFQEITLSSAFSNPGSTRYDGRRLANPIVGVPPTAQGLSLFSNPMPVKKILHYQEN